MKSTTLALLAVAALSGVAALPCRGHAQSTDSTQGAPVAAEQPLVDAGDSPSAEAPAPEAAIAPTEGVPAEAAPLEGVPEEMTPIAPRTVIQARDDERPPGAERYARSLPPELPASVVNELASPIPDRLEGRRYPTRGVNRPLTLSEGQARLDQGFGARTSTGGVMFFAPQQLSLGITNDFEMALIWPIMRDPGLQATGRVYSSPELDVGVRGTLTVPAITTGNTVARLGMPIVIRAGNFLRIVTGIDVDLLFTPQISPMVVVPLQIQVQGSNRLFFGVQGSLALIDGRAWTGEVGTFLAHTNSAYAGGPIMESRIAVTWLVEEKAGMINGTLTFFPRLW